MAAPAQIAHYKITGKLGEGGMGAVYRATDTKLNREVAIKLLPDALDADRVARFAREAQVLAALNHPNIATIYGVEDRAIIMELVDGKPLQGPVDEDTAMGLITQLIDALEYAHDKAIIHRDLKPANILVTADGRVKVLDFGLAKALAGERVGTGNPETSPTLTMRATEVGLIMGTASYMSPEQARGATVDKRADIWSFGVVLYELLTGKQLFGGDNVSDILADVLKQEIDFSPVPARFRKLVSLCLTRDLKPRLREISAARHFLDGGVERQVAAKPSRLPWAVAGLAVVLGAAAWLWPKPTPPPALGAVRFQIPLPEGTTWARGNAIASAVPSPDGKYIALALADKQGAQYLWLRSLESTKMQKLERTEDAATPFWSPDSQSIAYFTSAKLMRVAIATGAVQTVCNCSSGASSARGGGGAWGEDGSIVFAIDEGPLLRVPAGGGAPAPLSKLEKGEIGHRYPQFLPGGDKLLFHAGKQQRQESSVEILDLASGNRVILTRNETKAVWAPPGFLVFARDGSILVQKMRLSPPSLEGEPVTLDDGVVFNTTGTARSSFMVSPAGVLAYRRSTTGGGATASVLVWYDRKGRRGDVFNKNGNPTAPTISPDGKSVAMYQVDSTNHLWVADVRSGVATKLTNSLGIDPVLPPIWSDDSKRIIVTGNGIREIEIGSGKDAEVLAGGYFANALEPDSKSLLVTASGGKALFLLPPGPGAQPRRLAESTEPRFAHRVSPDGRLVTYRAAQEGRSVLFVASYPAYDQRKKVGAEGEAEAMWSRSGQELYYWTQDGSVYSANVRSSPAVEIDPPVQLFRVPNRHSRSAFAVTADGQRFLIPEVPAAPEGDSVHVILNWTGLVK